MNRRTIITLSLALATLLTILSILATIQSTQRSGGATSEQHTTIQISICIDYGNGTRVWFNNTRIPKDFNLLNATMLVAEVNYTYWPAYKASFVDAINGIKNESPYFWMWYYWDVDGKKWKLGPVGADRYRLKPGEVVMWRYEVPAM